MCHQTVLTRPPPQPAPPQRANKPSDAQMTSSCRRCSPLAPCRTRTTWTRTSGRSGRISGSTPCDSPSRSAQPSSFHPTSSSTAEPGRPSLPYRRDSTTSWLIATHCHSPSVGHPICHPIIISLPPHFILFSGLPSRSETQRISRPLNRRCQFVVEKRNVRREVSVSQHHWRR